jgi:hypothetical protein
VSRHCRRSGAARAAIGDLDEILDVPGIDAIYVGPADLAFLLGKTPKLDSEDAGQLGMYEVVCRDRPESTRLRRPADLG